MRKLRYSVLCLFFAVMLAFAGCGGTGTETSGADTGAEDQSGKEALTDAEKNKNGAPVGSLTVGGVDIGEFTVVINSENNNIYRLAYTDFINYIEKATGIRLKKVKEGEPSEHEICLGATDRDTERVLFEREKLQNDGYSVIFDEGRLYISGKNDNGTLFGVYSFLEDCVGCRFYSYDCETVKPAEKIDISSDICVNFSPKFESRDLLWRDATIASFSPKLKLNGTYSSVVTNPNKHVENRLAHTLDWLAQTSGTPCLTDEKVFETVLKNVRTLLKQNPDCNVISVSQLDVAEGCSCVNCGQINGEERSPMGSLLAFVNRIADAIKDEYPDVYIETLAYSYTHTPPLTIKPADNVIIRFCTDEACSSHAIGPGGCNKNYNGWLREWSKKTGNLFIWDYTTDFYHYIIPLPNFHTIYENMQTFLKYGVKGVFSQGNHQPDSISGEFGELRVYLLAKLLWEPDMSRERYYEYMDDFLEGYNGAGWTYIREYIDTLTERVEGLKNSHMTMHSAYNETMGLAGMSKTEKADFIASLEELWDKALAASDEEHYARVEKSSIQIRFASCLADPKPDQEKNKALYKLLRKYDIKYLSEVKKLPSSVNLKKSVSTWYSD